MRRGGFLRVRGQGDRPHRGLVPTVRTWDVLVLNQDIAQWIACLLFGANQARCIVERINGERGPQYIEPSRRYTFMHTDFFGRGRDGEVIELNVNYPWWRSIVLAWPTASAENRLCYAVFTGQALYHELLHQCFPFVGPSEGPFHANTRCDPVYAAGNSLAWALSKRYTCLAESECCQMGRECTWMNADARPDCWQLQGSCP